MGKSDPIVFSKYFNILRSVTQKSDLGELSICFLGFSGPNIFTNSIASRFNTFYDLSLKNWNINDKKWNIEKNYFDIVICTRVAYFSQNPNQLIKNCHNILKTDGILLIDWGLGDHWRFDKYKIGWVKDDEHEYAYHDDNFLWSCVWDDSFLEHPEFIKFSNWVEKFGYSDVKEAIDSEVPSLATTSTLTSLFNISCDIVALWEESPQLYLIFCGRKV